MVLLLVLASFAAAETPDMHTQVSSETTAPTTAPRDETDHLLRLLSRSANGMLEMGTRYVAEEKAVVRILRGPDRWESAEIISELRFHMGEQGLQESRKLIESSGSKLKPPINDISQLILLFATATLNRFSFERNGIGFVGPEQAAVFRYSQHDGPESLTIREGRKRRTQPIHGEVWVRADGSAVLRVTVDVARGDDIRDHAEVDYITRPDGAPVPVSATHREYHNGDMVAETIFSYRQLPDAH